MDKREYSGPLWKQIDDAFQFVLRNIRLGARLEGIYRKDIYELLYSVEEAVAFKECSLLRFDSPDAAWLDFVAENRQGKQHDLIYGAVANDDVYRTITLYMTGVLDKEQTLAALKIRKLFNQLVFATEKSLQYLYFEGGELV